MVQIYQFKPRKKKILKKLLNISIKNKNPAWLIIAICIAAVIMLDNDNIKKYTNTNASTAEITCSSPYIIDGDTFDCSGNRIRLAGIDAPEMPGHCKAGRKCTPGDPYAAREKLINLSRGKVSCRKTDTDHYGRAIARCEANGVDLSCAMIKSGNAVRRYGFINCFNK